jgi:hypothetical protein
MRQGYTVGMALAGLLFIVLVVVVALLPTELPGTEPHDQPIRETPLISPNH